MQIALNRKPRRHPPLLRKLIRIMKLTFILLTAVALQVSAKGYTQKITLSVKDAPLEKVFESITNQSGYRFFYNEEQLQRSRPVTIQVKETSLEKALDLALKGQPFTYAIINKVIVIKEKINDLAIQTPLESPSLVIDVKGRVVNENNEPVSGASVKVKGSDKGASTNEEGEFFLHGVEENAVLVISHISLETQEIKVNGQTAITVQLKLNVGKLDLVTINTGYQTLKPNEVTGSVVVIAKEQLDRRVAPTILEKLEGITNGLVFNKDPQDGSNKLRIRGESTIYGYENPLVVVDNFPYKFEQINEINPNDVESITILKDAAAASIWGVQAGNGVIVITTKRGKINQPLTVGVNINTTISTKPDLYYAPMISPSDYIDVETNLFRQGIYDIDLINPDYPVVSPIVEILNNRMLGLISPADSAAQITALRGADWRKEYLKHIYQNAVAQQYQVNLSGGSNKVGYYFSVGYDKSLSSFIGDESKRITLNNSATFRPVKNLELQLGLFYSESKSINNSDGGNVPNLFPYTQLKDASGNDLAVPQRRAGFEDTISNHGFLNWKYYPLQERSARDNTSKSYSTRIFASLKYSLLKGLNIEGLYQYYRALGKIKNLATKESYNIRNSMNMFAILNSDGNYTGSNYPVGGFLFLSNSDLLGHNGRIKLDYSKTFGDHSIGVVAGFDVREETTESHSSALLGYDDATGSFVIPNTIEYHQTYYPSGFSSIAGDNPYGFTYAGTISRVRSYYGIADYTYKNRYSIQGSLRFDGSNYFGVKTNNKTVPLWSVGGKWNLSKEKFYRYSNQVPELSLRATYGYNGNLSPSVVAITTAQYASIANFTGLPYAIIMNVPNPELRWEKSGQLNIGIDFSLKNNIVSGSIEFFKKNGKDLIGDAPIDPTSGITRLRGNFSDMKSTGMDIQITSKNIDKAFKWSTTLIFNYAKETVTRYELPPIVRSFLVAYKGNILPQEGFPLRSLFSYRWGGLNPLTGDPRIILADTLFSDYSSNLSDIKLADLVYNGRYDPPYAGSLSNRFSWKGVTLVVNMVYKFGHHFRRSGINYFRLATDKNGWNLSNRDYALRWQNTGDEQFTDVPSFIFPDNSNGQRDDFYNSSDILVDKAAHVRLQFVSLDYSLGTRMLKKLHFDNLSIYFYANNLGILWRANKHGIDPDHPYLGYPPSKTYSFGLRAGF